MRIEFKSVKRCALEALMLNPLYVRKTYRGPSKHFYGYIIDPKGLFRKPDSVQVDYHKKSKHLYLKPFSETAIRAMFPLFRMVSS